MPQKRNPTVLPTIRGEPPYDRFLTRLLKAVQKSSPTVKTRMQLAELAIAELAARHGLIVPRRCAPAGTNRFGEPKSASDAAPPTKP